MKASPTPDLSAAGPVEASNDSDSSGYNTNTKLNGTQSQPAVNSKINSYLHANSYLSDDFHSRLQIDSCEHI